MYRIILIIILSLFGIFIRPFDPGTIDFIYRFVVFASITYLLYAKWKDSESDELETKSAPAQKSQDKTENILFDEEWNISDFLETDDKSAEFLKDQFDVMCSFLFPDTGLILYQQNAEDVVVFHTQYRGGTSNALEPSSFSGHGIFEIMAREDDILIENNLSRESQLIPYHSDPAYQPRSFLGIPIKLTTEKRLYFAFDSQNKDHFNQEERLLFEKMAKDIEIFLINRLRGRQLLRALRKKEDLLKFAQDLNGSKTITLAIDVLAKEVADQFEASRLTISTVSSDGEEAVIRKVVGEANHFTVDSTFKLEEGLTGWIIGKNKPYLIDDLEKGEFFIPRYSKSEKSNLGMRAFLGLPIVSENRVFGAITLEHKSPNKYNQNHKTRLQTYIDLFSTTFNRQKS